MIKRIDRPGWKLMLGVFANETYQEDSIKRLNRWYDQFIIPLNRALDEAVVVYARVPEGDWPTVWVQANKRDDTTDTHRALLIGIEPLKQETCADVLRDMIEKTTNTDREFVFAETSYWYERAKAALSREEGE